LEAIIGPVLRGVFYRLAYGELRAPKVRCAKAPERDANEVASMCG
jgi:hypothetical protein